MPLNNGGIAPGITQNLLKSRLDSFHTQTRQQSLFAGDSAERNPVRLQETLAVRCLQIYANHLIAVDENICRLSILDKPIYLNMFIFVAWQFMCILFCVLYRNNFWIKHYLYDVWLCLIWIVCLCSIFCIRILLYIYIPVTYSIDMQQNIP